MMKDINGRRGCHRRTAANKAPIRHSRSAHVRSEALVATRALGICEQIEHAQEELAHKAVAPLPPIPRPAPCPAPQAPLLVARNRPTAIARKRWRIAREPQ